MVSIGNDWDEVLSDLFASENYRNIREFLKKEYSTYTVYPSMYDIFNAFRFTPYGKVKAVLLGQDPYHEPGQAHGLCFSVKKGIPAPPSLVNIFKEMKSDLGIDPPEDGDLTKWAERGVLLLNTTLTVRRGQANSHRNCGWTAFTDGVIQKLSARETPMVFLLWGGNARAKKPLIDGKKHLVLECAHPSPLSCYNGFFGCRHFSKANAFLKEKGLGEIDWNLND
ncbi:MAG: uracil-DNA glycosylase [Candidatus Borkfalkiaceae bacterium]|nr:uracil-DNA glycosylase [Christensenellaceae bacterium]